MKNQDVEGAGRARHSRGVPARARHSRGVPAHALGGAHLRVGRAVHLGHVHLGVLQAVVLVSQVVPGWLQPLAVSTPVTRGR